MTGGLIVSAESTYLLDNANAKADTRMDVLARLYDEPTQRALERAGVGAGWHCLEVGGGGGSVARWLAARVGAKGRVLCTDINTRIIEGHRGNTPANLEVQRHDIANDPLPEASLRPGARTAGADPRAAARTRAGAHGRGPQARRVAGHRGFRLGFDPARRRHQSRGNADTHLRGGAPLPHARARTAISAADCMAAFASWDSRRYTPRRA